MEFDKNLPVYWQITEIVKMRIIRQEYAMGCFIPTVRVLADEFKVTSNTLQKACFELVRDGWLLAIRGLGYKVTTDKRMLNKLCTDFIERRFVKLHEEMKKMNISDIDLCKRFDKFIKRDELEK